MNIWTFTGNLGKDCSVAYTQSGAPICNFSVAVKSGYGDREKTTWVNCVLLGKRAEGKLPDYLLKGAAVCVSGEAYIDEWDGSDGTKNKMLKLTVDKLDLIGGKPEKSEAANNSARHASGNVGQQNHAASAQDVCMQCGMPENIGDHSECIPF